MKRIPATTKRAKEGWEHIPLVKLSRMLKQMIWFSDSVCTMTRTVFYESDYDRTDYEQDGTMPRTIQIFINYRGHSIKLKCIWEDREEKRKFEPHPEKYPNRFAIGILAPLHPDFQTRRLYTNDSIKFKYSRYYSNTIDKIEDAIYDAQEVIDKNIEEEEEEEKRIKEIKVTKENLCKNFDLEITSDDECFSYREDAEYCFHFKLLEDGFYEIESIGGKYTEAEIKKIIKLVGGNSRAIAERLLKSK